MRRMELLELLADGEWHQMTTDLWRVYRYAVNDAPPGLIEKRSSLFPRRGWPQPELRITAYGLRKLEEWQ